MRISLLLLAAVTFVCGNFLAPYDGGASVESQLPSLAQFAVARINQLDSKGMELVTHEAPLSVEEGTLYSVSLDNGLGEVEYIPWFIPKMQLLSNLLTDAETSPRYSPMDLTVTGPAMVSVTPSPSDTTSATAAAAAASAAATLRLERGASVNVTAATSYKLVAPLDVDVEAQDDGRVAFSWRALPRLEVGGRGVQVTTAPAAPLKSRRGVLEVGAVAGSARGRTGTRIVLPPTDPLVMELRSRFNIQRQPLTAHVAEAAMRAATAYVLPIEVVHASGRHAHLRVKVADTAEGDRVLLAVQEMPVQVGLTVEDTLLLNNTAYEVLDRFEAPAPALSA